MTARIPLRSRIAPLAGASLRRRIVVLASAALACAGAAMAAPSGAAAAELGCTDSGVDERTCTYRFPISVGGYEVLQNLRFPSSAPEGGGFVTKMETDVVDEDGTPVPISRLMLHHIVFVNPSAGLDNTCGSFLNWDSQSSGFAFQRFYAAGEERARLSLPEGYGYKFNGSPWGVLYMVMNHRASADSAYVQYTVTVSDDPETTEVEPYWLDVANCRADPIYNVPGTGRPGSTHLRTSDVVMPISGRIVAGAGHVHGGAKGLTVSQPDCSHRQVAASVPTWGLPKHPFYNVRPILHEPGPINMTGFHSAEGIPVAQGERIRLNSLYDNSLPHTRVMGIMQVYIAPGPVASKCAPLPTDVESFGTNQPGRPGPVSFKVPLTGLNSSGQAVTINAPPGKLRRVKGGSTLAVGDRYFAQPNALIRPGQRLNWRFSGAELHNLTLANGPVGIASDNLDGSRVFNARFPKKGTYRFFCSLHPVQMSQRVVVKKKAKKKKRKKGKRKRSKRRGKRR